MSDHSQNFIIVVIWECANDFVFSRWQKLEIVLAELKIVDLQLCILVRTFADALGHPLLKKFDSKAQDIFLVYRIDEFTIIKFGNVTNLIILWENLEIDFEMNLKIIFQFHSGLLNSYRLRWVCSTASTILCIRSSRTLNSSSHFA